MLRTRPPDNTFQPSWEGLFTDHLFKVNKPRCWQCVARASRPAASPIKVFETFETINFCRTEDLVCRSIRVCMQRPQLRDRSNSWCSSREFEVRIPSRSAGSSYNTWFAVSDTHGAYRVASVPGSGQRFSSRCPPIASRESPPARVRGNSGSTPRGSG